MGVGVYKIANNCYREELDKKMSHFGSLSSQCNDTSHNRALFVHQKTFEIHSFFIDSMIFYCRPHNFSKAGI